MRRSHRGGRTAVVVTAAAVSALAVAGCTGTASEPPAGRASFSPSASASPSGRGTAAAGAQAVLRSASGRTYRIRVHDEGRTTVTLTGAPGENLRKEYVTAGRYLAPQVVPGGPLEGLSPDGRWLVLETHAPQPNERSVFLILSGTLDDDRDTIDLPGRFTFDAWSTKGDVLYLVEHKPPAGSGHYVVRAYDMRTQSLRKEPVADKRNVEEQMAGQPVARAATPGGAVVATLYVRQGHEAKEHGPFVHVLYVDEGQALCVDLPPGLPVATGWQLTHDGGWFVVKDTSGANALAIDPASGEITR